MADRGPLSNESDLFGSQRTYQFLTEYRASRSRAGTLVLKEPALAAVQFLEMVKGDHYVRALPGEEIALNARERKHVVDQAVEIFPCGAELR